MALRIKSKWTQKAREHISQALVRENAQALAFIYWRIALDKAINLHGEDFVYDTDEQRIKIIAEYLAMLIQVSDRLAYARMEDAERQEFITTLALRLSDHMQDNGTDLFGEADYRGPFIDMLNERSAEYAEYEYSLETGPSYNFLHFFGSQVQKVMGTSHHSNKWAMDQAMEIDGPEAIEKATRAMENLFS